MRLSAIFLRFPQRVTLVVELLGAEHKLVGYVTRLKWLTQITVCGLVASQVAAIATMNETNAIVNARGHCCWIIIHFVKRGPQYCSLMDSFRDNPTWIPSHSFLNSYEPGQSKSLSDSSVPQKSRS
jgi:hypothetical protein